MCDTYKTKMQFQLYVDPKNFLHYSSSPPGQGASLSVRGFPSQKFYPLSLISAADAKADNASTTEV